MKLVYVIFIAIWGHFVFHNTCAAEEWGYPEDVKFRITQERIYLEGSKFKGKSFYDFSIQSERDLHFSDYEYLHQNFYDIKKLEVFAESKPTSDFVDEALIQIAELNFKKGNIEAGNSYLDKVIKDYSESAYISLSDLFFYGDGSGRVFSDDSYRQCIYFSCHPNLSSDYALLLKVAELRKSKHFDESIKLLETFIKSCPEGRWTDSDADYIKQYHLFTLERFDEQLYLQLINCYIDAGQLSKTLELSKKTQGMYFFSDNIWRYLNAEMIAYKFLNRHDEFETARKKLIDYLSKIIGKEYLEEYYKTKSTYPPPSISFSQNGRDAWNKFLELINEDK